VDAFIKFAIARAPGGGARLAVLGEQDGELDVCLHVVSALVFRSINATALARTAARG
jgi:hypothetical protein